MGEFAEHSASAPDFGPLFGARASEGAIPLRDRAKGALEVISPMRAEAVGAPGLYRAGAWVFCPSIATKTAPMAEATVAL